MSIWGAVQDSTSIFRGCRFVSTASHGGIILTEGTLNKHPSLEKLRTFADIQSYCKNGKYYFEEDSQAKLVVSLLNDEVLQEIYPDSTPEGVRQRALDSLVEYNPDYYTHITGKGLSIFDSPKLWDEFVKANPENYLIKYAFSDSNYNVPKGHTYFVVENGHGAKVGLITTQENYRYIYFKLNNHPININDYERFTLDETLPMSQPSTLLENGFFITDTQAYPQNENGLVAKAYSYQSNEYKYFQMTKVFYESICSGKYSEAWIQYTSADHTQLTDDFDVFTTETTQAEYEKLKTN